MFEMNLDQGFSEFAEEFDKEKEKLSVIPLGLQLAELDKVLPTKIKKTRNTGRRLTEEKKSEVPFQICSVDLDLTSSANKNTVFPLKFEFQI